MEFLLTLFIELLGFKPTYSVVNGQIYALLHATETSKET